MSLYLSINTQNKIFEKRPIDRAIAILAANVAVEKRNGHFPKGPSLDVTFMLASKEESTHLQSMRMGGYSDDDKTLFFESAVPEHIAHSNNAPRYVAFALQDVIDNAGDYFKNQRIVFDEAQWHRAIIPLIRTASILSKSN